MDVTAVVLAGGLGTRLQTVVADRPKVLAPVAVAFKAFLLQSGAGLIDQVTRQPGTAVRRRR